MAKKKYYADIDLCGNELQNAVIPKLDGIEEHAQVNVIEHIEVNSSEQPIINKSINITVPTKTSDIVNDSDFCTNDILNNGLNLKVDKVSGKSLSTNDFSNDYKTKVDDNVASRHTHSNKGILDNTQESFTTTLKNNLDTNTQNRHSHSNKSVLDATSASFTSSDKTKLNGITSGAQVNVIETIKVNNTALPISDKAVNITVPTKTSQLQNDSTFVTLADLDSSEAGTVEGLAGKVDKIEGKGLSTNDFSNDYKTKVDTNALERHSHSNKSILDNTQQAFTTSLKTDITDNKSARHTHSNKTILDATTASFTTAINNTINKKANDADVVKLTGVQTISGGKTFLNPISLPNRGLNIVGDDAYFGDQDQAGCICIKGQNGATGLYFMPYSGSSAQKISIDGTGKMTVTGTLQGNFSGNLTGTADKATKDANGNNIVNTYATKAQISPLPKKEVFTNPALVSVEGVSVWTVTHNLNTQDLCASVRRISDNAQVLAEIIFTSTTQVTIKMNTDVAVDAGTYKLTLIG